MTKTLFLLCLLRVLFFLFSNANHGEKLEMLEGKAATFSGFTAKMSPRTREVLLIANKINNRKTPATGVRVRNVPFHMFEELSFCQEERCSVSTKTRVQSIKREAWKNTAVTSLWKDLIVTHIKRASLAGRVRCIITDWLEHFPEERSRIFLKAFITGLRGYRFREIQHQFRELGISHLAVISGLHMSMIYLAISNLIRMLFLLIAILSGRFINSVPLEELIALLCVTLYFIMLPASIPATRAYIMLIGHATGKWLPLKISPMRIFSTAALLVILIFPDSIFSYSFYLSFMSVFALKIWSMISRGNPENPLLGFLEGLMTSGLIVFVFTFSLNLLFFQKIQLHGIFLNMLFIPLTFLLYLFLIINFSIPGGTVAWSAQKFTEGYLDLIEHFYFMKGLILTIEEISPIESIGYIGMILLISLTIIYKRNFFLSLRI